MHRTVLARFGIGCVAAAAALVFSMPAARAAEPRPSARATPSARPAEAAPQVAQFRDDVKALGDRLTATASPAVKAWSGEHAATIAKAAEDPEVLARAAVQARWPQLRFPGAADALAFVVTYEAAKLAQASLKRALEAASPMGELEALRDQMAGDRLAKLMSTLSNLLKKASEAGQGIIQNLR